MRFLQLILAVLVLLDLPACRQLSAALLTQGNHDYQKSDYARAIQDYNGAIRLDPTSDRAWNDRGVGGMASTAAGRWMHRHPGSASWT
jgi:Flp pilus assembly protein TadD